MYACKYRNNQQLPKIIRKYISHNYILFITLWFSITSNNITYISQNIVKTTAKNDSKITLHF